MSTAMLILFILSAIAHLTFSYADHSVFRARTKPFPLLFLLLYYLTSVSSPDVFLVLALFTSLLGDILLIFPGNKYFVIGGISFLFAHVFFILVYSVNLWDAHAHLSLLIPAAAIYLLVSILVVQQIADHTPKSMLAPMWLYLLTNSAMNTAALIQYLTLRSRAAGIAYAGALLFYISDCLLFLVRYHKNKDLVPKRHFFVMFCYLAGEFLITRGMLML
jgi:uncharacterized membrane protein YhhN